MDTGPVFGDFGTVDKLNSARARHTHTYVFMQTEGPVTQRPSGSAVGLCCVVTDIIVNILFTFCTTS
jgi:hypothetical protein